MQINLDEILNHFATVNKISLNHLYRILYSMIFNITHTALKKIEIKQQTLTNFRKINENQDLLLFKYTLF